MKPILFIDRDGTLVEEPADYQVDTLAKIRLCKGVIPALQRLSQAGFEFVMVSNQDGLGTVSFPEADFQPVHDFILELFASQGIIFSEIFICPHTPQDNCTCRKPKTGLLDDYFQKSPILLSRSWVIGDRDSDRQLADNLGLAYLPVSVEHDWKQVADAILNQARQGSVFRKTKETSISVTLTLDAGEPSAIDTPIAFFSHMLEQIAKHGGFALKLTAEGDTDVDDHHLIEDTAIALGEALKMALGDKWGIDRYGFTLPMDESLATVAIDLSGRPFCEFKGTFTREFVGGMATEMVPHFFKSLSYGLGATLHIQVQGENHHHMVEACFKGLGRTLRQAIKQSGNDLPSTKGVL